jgi:DNA-binding transcriptional LysR family regulator
MQDRLVGMRVIAQVVQSKSFSAAAQKLGISKSLASRHVSALDASLAVKLLNRSTRKLSLTEAGAVIYEHAARIVQEAEIAEQRLTQVQSDPAGLIRITAVPALAARYVVPAIAEFQQKYPKIRIELSCDNRTLDPADEGFDLGIRVSRKPPPHLVARRLAPNRAVLCATPTYLERRGTPRRIDDLARHACVIFPPVAPKGVWSLRRGPRRYAVKVSGSLETNDMESVHAAVVAGLGIGILPLYLAADALNRGALRRVLEPVEAAGDSAVYLVYLPNRTLSSRVRAVIDFFTTRFAPGPPWELAP